MRTTTRREEEEEEEEEEESDEEDCVWLCRRRWPSERCTGLWSTADR